MRRDEQLPDWPAAMRRSTAARYLDLSEAEFAREVAAGLIPAPFRLGRADHWRKQAIDIALGLHLDPPADDWRSRARAYAGVEVQQPAEAHDLREDEPIEQRTRAFTAAILAARWGLSTGKIYKMYHAGEVRGFKLGDKLIRFDPVEVAAAEERLHIKP